MASLLRPGWRGWLFLLSVLLAAPAATAVAQSAGDLPTEVGRVVLIDGAVSFRAVAGEPWGAALANLPLIAGASLSTGPSGRAAFALAAARFWLDGESEIAIDSFDDHVVTVTLAQGRVDISLGGLAPGDSYTVSTPAGPVVLESAGFYRVTAGDRNHAPGVAVFAGRADFSSGGGTQTVEGGQEAFAAGSPSLFGPAIEDRFDQWANDLGGRDNGGFASQYVPAGIPGADDLDAYGQWRVVPDYGTVWVPTQVAINWAPYRDGQWQWIEPWGWTWVDHAPWGFAPFHYGRWVKLNGWWSWVPGQKDRRPVYAPALVNFAGNPGPRTGGNGPGVTWTPLGPNDRYRPSRTVNSGHAMSTNSVTIINRNPVANAQPLQNGLSPLRPAVSGGTGASPQGGAWERRRMVVPPPRRSDPSSPPFQNGTMRPEAGAQMLRQAYGPIGAVGAPSAAIRPVLPVGGAIQPLRPIAPLAPLRPNSVQPGYHPQQFQHPMPAFSPPPSPPRPVAPLGQQGKPRRLQ